MKIFNSLLLLFIGINCFSQANDTLISHQLFITGEQRFSFKLSPDGDVVYFQTTSDKSQHYCFINSSGFLHTIKIPFKAYSWEVANNAVLVASQDSLSQLIIVSNDGIQKTIAPAFTFKNIRILTRAVNNVFALDITALILQTPVSTVLTQQQTLSVKLAGRKQPKQFSSTGS